MPNPSRIRISSPVSQNNPGDVRLTQEVFKEGKIRNRLNVAWNGEEALAYLRREHRFANAPRPDIILLDLNLPRKGGREVLAEIKADPKLQCIPVVVLTTSQAEQDITESYTQHATCYIVQPVELDHFVNVVRSVEGFWLKIVKLPPGEE